MTSLFSRSNCNASSYASLRICITSESISDAVCSAQFNALLPSRYLPSTVSNPIRPNFLLIPYLVTIERAIPVAFSISLEAPVVTVSNMISSAARPPSNPTIISCNSACVFRYFSSSGTCITYPNAPIVLGTIVIFCTGSEFFCNALTNA